LKSTMISRRLVTFQVFFLKNICKPKNLTLTDLLNNYNKRWGRPTNQQKNMLVKAVNEILLKNDNINSWLEYFEKLGIKKYKTNLEVCNALKKAVINSKKKEYHRPNERKMKSRRKTAAYSTDDFTMKEAKLNVTESEIIEMQGELEGHTESVTCIKPLLDNPNRIITGSRDKSIIIWDLTTKTSMRSRMGMGMSCDVRITEGKMVRRLKGHNHFISDIDVSTDGNYVLSASWDGLLKLWNTKNGRSTTKYVGHKKDVLSVQFSPDNRKIISCGRDKTINLWNTIGEIKQQIHNAHNGWINGIAFSPNPDDHIFVSASNDKSIKVWEYNDESSTYSLKYQLSGEHKSCITSIAVSPDGSLCASGDKYGVLCLFDAVNGKHLTTLRMESGSHQINCITFSPNRYWVCCAVSGSIEIWDLETKNNVGILKTAKGLSELRRGIRRSMPITCNCIAWSYDGKTLFSGYDDHKIKIWKLISPMDGLNGDTNEPVIKFEM